MPAGFSTRWTHGRTFFTATTLPRLVEKNTMMSRLTGGIGGRGPGETKLEINRRRAREKITDLDREIEHLEKRRQLTRKREPEHGRGVRGDADQDACLHEPPDRVRLQRRDGAGRHI